MKCVIMIRKYMLFKGYVARNKILMSFEIIDTMSTMVTKITKEKTTFSTWTKFIMMR